MKIQGCPSYKGQGLGNFKAFCNLGSFGKCSKFSLNNGANAKHEKPLLKK